MIKKPLKFETEVQKNMQDLKSEEQTEVLFMGILVIAKSTPIPP